MSQCCIAVTTMIYWRGKATRTSLKKCATGPNVCRQSKAGLD